MTQTKALRLALEALENITSVSICEATHHAKKDRHLLCEECPNEVRHLKAITAIKAALANEALERKAENARELGLDYEPLEAKDEPVGRLSTHTGVGKLIQMTDAVRELLDGTYDLYIAPPQRKPLTDEQIEDAWASCEVDWDDKVNVITLARAIEAAHGIKGESA